MDTFERALAFTLKWEGGYVNHPADRGGATNRGITQRTYDIWRAGRGQRPRDVKQLHEDELRQIYHEYYWLAGKCEQMPTPVNLAHFDAFVNHKPQDAVKLLQRAAGVLVDGKLGPITLGKVERWLKPVTLAQRQIEERRRFFERIVSHNPSQGVFLRGWLNRCDALELEVLKG